MCSSDILLALLAILFPPIAVWIKSGICTADSLINILLCMLGYIPGLLHAWYIISLYPEPDHEYEYIGDAESGQPQRVTYYYVDTTNGSGGGESQRTSAGQEGGGQREYGTVAGVREGHQQQQQQQQWQGMQYPGDSQQGQGGVPPTYEQAIKGGH